VTFRQLLTVIPSKRSLGKCEEHQEKDEGDKYGSNYIYDSPIVVYDNKAYKVISLAQRLKIGGHFSDIPIDNNPSGHANG
jgi:hypothetical protein